jgi:predicted PurR-regulated permease PerM
MGETAKRTAVVTTVAVAIIAGALALWELRVLISLILLGLVLAAAMRPGVDALARRRVPRAGGVALHYAALAGIVGLALWLVVPRAIDQLSAALGTNGVPTSAAELNQSVEREAKQSKGIKHDILVGIQKRLKRLPSGSALLHPAVTVTKAAFEAVIGTFFLLAVAAYWIFDRDRAIALACSLASRRKRRLVRDTWLLIDLKLGAYVRGQLLLVVFVATVLSLAFWAIGLPYWILIGISAGVVELVPIVGPLAAGALAVGVGLTDSITLAVEAGAVVFAVRMLEDYIVIPRVLGHAVGLSPLVVLVSVTALGLLLGGLFVLLAIPIAAVLATLVDVIVRDRDPAKEEVPAVLFSTDVESAAR